MSVAVFSILINSFLFIVTQFALQFKMRLQILSLIAWFYHLQAIVIINYYDIYYVTYYDKIIML